MAIPYWQEFFGRIRLTPRQFFAVFFILALLSVSIVFAIIHYGNISAEKEKRWIETSNPRTEAEKAYQENKIAFLQIWVEKAPAEKEDPHGIWITPAEREIGVENLKRFPLKQLSTSSKWNEDMKPYDPKAMEFASKFNSRLTELVSKRNSEKE